VLSTCRTTQSPIPAVIVLSARFFLIPFNGLFASVKGSILAGLQSILTCILADEGRRHTHV
jgi:hypothetical protein